MPNQYRQRTPLRWVLPFAVIAAAGAWWALHSRPATPTATAAPAAPVEPGVFRPTPEQWVNLKVEPVSTLAFRDTLTTDGNIGFNEDTLTPVYSPYSGRVGRVIAKLGDVVRKGAPLLTVDASEVVQAQSDVAAAKAALDLATANEKRQHDLLDAGAAALKDWRQSQSDLTAAQTSYESARGRLKILGKSDAEIDELEKGAQTRTSATVTAPIDGTITQRQVGVGEYITSASGGAANPVYTIGNLSSVWLVANVRESDAPLLRVGQPAEVRVLALPGQVFKARLTWVSASVDPVTHRLPVRAEVQNPEGLLKPAMFASFSIATSEPQQAIAVPASAVVFEGETARVFVVRDANSVAVRSIRIGRRQQGMLEVTDGLKADDKIVTAGALFVDRAAAGD